MEVPGLAGHPEEDSFNDDADWGMGGFVIHRKLTEDMRKFTICFLATVERTAGARVSLEYHVPRPSIGWTWVRFTTKEEEKGPALLHELTGPSLTQAPTPRGEEDALALLARYEGLKLAHLFSTATFHPGMSNLNRMTHLPEQLPPRRDSRIEGEEA